MKPVVKFKYVVKCRNNKLEVWATLLTKSVLVSINQPATIIVSGEGKIHFSVSHKS